MANLRKRVRLNTAFALSSAFAVTVAGGVVVPPAAIAQSFTAKNGHEYEIDAPATKDFSYPELTVSFQKTSSVEPKFRKGPEGPTVWSRVVSDETKTPLPEGLALDYDTGKISALVNEDTDVFKVDKSTGAVSLKSGKDSETFWVSAVRGPHIAPVPVTVKASKGTRDAKDVSYPKLTKVVLGATGDSYAPVSAKDGATYKFNKDSAFWTPLMEEKLSINPSTGVISFKNIKTYEDLQFPDSKVIWNVPVTATVEGTDVDIFDTLEITPMALDVFDGFFRPAVISKDVDHPTTYFYMSMNELLILPEDFEMDEGHTNPVRGSAEWGSNKEVADQHLRYKGTPISEMVNLELMNPEDLPEWLSWDEELGEVKVTDKEAAKAAAPTSAVLKVKYSIPSLDQEKVDSGEYIGAKIDRVIPALVVINPSKNIADLPMYLSPDYGLSGEDYIEENFATGKSGVFRSIFGCLTDGGNAVRVSEDESFYDAPEGSKFAFDKSMTWTDMLAYLHTNPTTIARDFPKEILDIPVWTKDMDDWLEIDPDTGDISYNKIPNAVYTNSIRVYDSYADHKQWLIPVRSSLFNKYLPEEFKETNPASDRVNFTKPWTYGAALIVSPTDLVGYSYDSSKVEAEKSIKITPKSEGKPDYKVKWFNDTEKPLPEWATIDPKTGVITANPPLGTKPGEKTFVVRTLQGRFVENVPVMINVESDMSRKFDPSYGDAVIVDRGGSKTIPAPSISPNTPEGTTFSACDDTPSWATVNKDGSIKVSPTEDAALGSNNVCVKVTYADGTSDNVTAVVNIVDDMSEAHNPSYAEGTEVRQGESAEIPAPSDVPSGTAFGKCDEGTPDWAEIDEETGAVKVSPGTDVEAGGHNVCVKVTYSDGTSETVNAPVTVNSNLAATTDISYPATGVAKGDTVTLDTPDGTPEGTKFSKTEGTPDWVEVSEAGSVTLKPGADVPAGTQEITVHVEYPDGTSKDITFSVEVKDMPVPTYTQILDAPMGKITTSDKPVGDYPVGTKFERCEDTPSWVGIALDGPVSVHPTDPNLIGSHSVCVNVTFPSGVQTQSHIDVNVVGAGEEGNGNSGAFPTPFVPIGSAPVGSDAVQSAPATNDQGNILARTGANVMTLLALGMLTVIAGAGALLFRRRRTQ